MLAKCTGILVFPAAAAHVKKIWRPAPIVSNKVGFFRKEEKGWGIGGGWFRDLQNLRNPLLF